MRGGRFQQKTSEEASVRNAEALFESRTVPEIRIVESETRKEIEEKKEELRQLVGASYRDLIESADSITNMKNLCQNVSRNIQEMESVFSSLKQRLATQTQPASLPHSLQSDIEKKQKRDKLYGIGSRVKYVVDTPEKIWGCLDEHMYLEGAQRYFRASEVHTLLTESEAKGENLSNFPLLLHQWSLVETFRGQISQRSRDRLLEPVLEVNQYAVALAAVAVIDELGPSQVVSFFFETRRAWLRSHLRTAVTIRHKLKKDKKASLDVDAIALVLSKAANIIQISLCHAGQLFLEVNGDSPLFFSTILNCPPGSQLFGGIPNPEEEVKLWKHRWEQLESRMSSLAPQFISETCTSWIEICRNDLMVEGQALLDLVESCKDLEKMEALIRNECESRKALEGSIEWLESAFGKSIDSPWDYVTTLLLKEHVDLWSILFERVFVERAKKIVTSRLSEINLEHAVDEILSSVASSLVNAEGGVNLGSTDLMWNASMDSFKRLDEVSDIAVGSFGKVREEDSSGVSDAYLGSEVSKLKDEINIKLKALLEDSVTFIQSQQNSARQEDLPAHLKTHCSTWMANVINALIVRLLELSDGSSGKMSFSLKSILESRDKAGTGNTKRYDELMEEDNSDALPSVEKALSLARLFIALSQRSWALPCILHPSKSWVSNDLAASVSESPLPWLPSLNQKTYWLDAKETFSDRHGRLRSIGDGDSSKEDSISEFSKLQIALKYSSLAAHSFWVSWIVERLSGVLEKSMVRDEDLMSSTPFKGWEETVLRQMDEKGDEIEITLPLPAMPSPYVISFLFKSCQEVYRVGGHALDKAVVQLFASRLLDKVLHVYENFISGLKNHKHRVSDKGILQMLFDLRFLGDVLAGGFHPYPDHDVFSKEEASLSSILSSSNLSRIKEMLFLKSGGHQHARKWLHSLQGRLSSLLDPIDWATYEPPLWENEQQSYQRCAIIFGFLVQLKHLYRDTAQRPPLTTESNIVKMSTSIPRFTYLPISTPSLAKKSLYDENGLKMKSMYLVDNGSNDDNSSFASVIASKQPLFQSLINQVGTLKLGSMLTDKQVSKFKDRSAAAISTFGDILPSQAAGLFTSFTTKSDG